MVPVDLCRNLNLKALMCVSLFWKMCMVGLPGFSHCTDCSVSHTPHSPAMLPSGITSLNPGLCHSELVQKVLLDVVLWVQHHAVIPFKTASLNTFTL